jgi:hypothetical protein
MQVNVFITGEGGSCRASNWCSRSPLQRSSRKKPARLALMVVFGTYRLHRIN